MINSQTNINYRNKSANQLFKNISINPMKKKGVYKKIKKLK